MATKADEKEVKDFLMNIIKKGGFPVGVCFGYMDSSAILLVRAEDDVLCGDAYGDCMFEGKTLTNLSDITDEGLFHLYKEGVRPGDSDYNDIIDELKDEGVIDGDDNDDEDDE